MVDNKMKLTESDLDEAIIGLSPTIDELIEIDNEFQMKGNNGKGNNEKRDLWETPKELFNLLDLQYEIEFDCCANLENRKVEFFSSEFEKLDETHINNFMCWMNPPFSKSLEMFKHFFKIVKTGVAIYRCDNMETKVWQEVILKNATWVFIPKGRVKYEGFEGNSSRFPSALIGFNVDPPKNIEGNLLFTSN